MHIYILSYIHIDILLRIDIMGLLGFTVFLYALHPDVYLLCFMIGKNI